LFYCLSECTSIPGFHKSPGHAIFDHVGDSTGARSDNRAGHGHGLEDDSGARVVPSGRHDDKAGSAHSAHDDVVGLRPYDLDSGWNVQLGSWDLSAHHLEVKRLGKELEGIREHLHALIGQEGSDKQDRSVWTRFGSCVDEIIRNEVGND
jgi:hypothetical protein